MERKTLRKNIGIKLKGLREAKGLTQESLAEALSFGDKNTVGKIERGDGYLSETFLIRASKFFNLPESYFYTFKDILFDSTKENFINVINEDLKECNEETLEKISGIIKILKCNKR